jgi:glycosyltransferase involved in cell wall biosynthesis
MHVVCVNYTFENSLTDPSVLLDRYETLTEWAKALAAAGVRASVVQRHAADSEIQKDGVLYRFVRDPAVRHGSVLDRPQRLHDVVRSLRPDVVHANGLHFGRQAAQLKAMLRGVPVLLQDHANLPPRNLINRWTLRKPLRWMDAISFVSREQSRPWVDAGLIVKEQYIVELMEGSSKFQRLQTREAARARSGLWGDPLCLWVGRLNPNKDPLTVLRGFAKALPTIGNARLAMIYSTEELLPSIHAWLGENPSVASRVALLGCKPHDELEVLYNSSDFFLLGSYHEGSGFAVLEALACGVTPVLTDIPSFRVLTGDGVAGGLWQVGNADSLAQVLTARYSVQSSETPNRVRAFFAANFSWAAIASRAIDVYSDLIEKASRQAR